MTRSHRDLEVPSDVRKENAASESAPVGLPDTATTVEQKSTAAAFLEDGVHRFAVLGIWALMLLFYIAVEPHKILQVATFQSIFGSQEPLVFLALAALCTFIVGEFDLSVSSVMGLTATIVPVLVTQHGLNVALASVVAVAIGGGCGIVNAFVVVVVGGDGFIVTLGSSTLLLGAALWVSKSTTVSGLSVSFGKISLTNFLGLPLTFY